MTSSTSVTSSTRASLVRLPIVSCRTSFALATSPSTVPLPASLTASVPSSLAKALAAYSDTSNLMTLLAPRGWTCVATYGADGSGGLVIAPHAESVPVGSWGAGWHLQHSSKIQAVTAAQSGGSSVQATAQACSIVPAAAAAFKSAFGHSCARRPASETVRPLSPTVVNFEDPPGTLHGIGIPSGGQYPANGVLTYTLPTVPGSYLATCTIPQVEHALCGAILNNFIRMYGKK